MNRFLIFFIITLTISACRYFGPVDGIVMKNVKTKPDNAELIGTWEVDSFSYQLTKEEYTNSKKSVKLKIDKTGELFALNLPDMVLDDFGRSIKDQFADCKGTWELDSINESWNFSVTYKPSGLYKSKTWTSYDLYKFKGELVIWVFLGDPDEARRLMFKKID